MDVLKDYTLNKTDNQKWLKAIGLFQIIGGAVGLLLFFVPGIGFAMPVLNLFYLAGIILFGVSIYAGQLAFRLKDNSLKWTILNQSLQLFSVFVGPYGYRYVSGACLNATIDFSVGFQLGVDFKLSTFSLALGSNQEKYFMSINFIAVYIIYKMENIKTEIKTKLEMQESLKKKNETLNEKRESIETPIIWTGDLSDDCSALLARLMLRAEWMDEDYWWWAVYDMENNEETVDSSNEYMERFIGGDAARAKAESVARKYLETK